MGATGLLGAPVAKALAERGHEVHRVSRHVVPSASAHRLDLTDFAATEHLLTTVQPRVIVHMTGGPTANPTEMAESNIVPTLSLLQAASRVAGVEALFVTGSAAEYGDPGEARASEGGTLKPLSGYGWIKLSEVATARELARLHELPLTIIRPFNPVSPDLPKSTALGNFKHQLLAGSGRRRRIVCGRVDVVRDFITTRFLGSAVAELIESPPGQTVNICSGVGVRLEDVMRAAAAGLGVDIQLDVDPHLAALPAPSRIVGDPGLLNSLIGVRPESTPEYLAAELFSDFPPSV